MRLVIIIIIIKRQLIRRITSLESLQWHRLCQLNVSLNRRSVVRLFKTDRTPIRRIRNASFCAINTGIFAR